MRNVLGRLLILVVETLDESLLTVPDIDEDDPPDAPTTTDAGIPSKVTKDVSVFTADRIPIH